MEREKNKIVSFKVERGGIVLYTEKGVYGAYYAEGFLLEIYEKLKNRYEYGQPEEEFFDYQDPKGAWILLNDFFEKTDYLRNVSLSDFEEYRAKYDIALNFKKGITIRPCDRSFSPELRDTFERFAKELDEWRIFDKEEIEHSEFQPDVFRYYSCGKMIDFVFALVHYFVFNGYKIRKCAHCGRLFAVKSLKEKYCSRPSTFNGYEQYSCKQAVKAIKDMLEKKRIAEYNRLEKRAKEYGQQSEHYSVWIKFNDTANAYKRKIKSEASISILQEYKNFLFDSENVRPKYQRIKNW